MTSIRCGLGVGTAYRHAARQHRCTTSLIHVDAYILRLALHCHTDASTQSIAVTMSVQFTEPDLQPTYQALISGTADYDWAIFNQVGNDLKVQATGNGLDDLEEEFMDGR